MLSLYEEFPDDPKIKSLLSGEPVEFAFIASVTPGRGDYPLRYSPPEKRVRGVFHYGIAARILPDGEVLDSSVFFLYPEWYEADATSASVDRREMEQLEPFKVYRARGTYYQTTIAIQHRFNIHELLPAEDDPELDALAEAVARPVVLEGPFGAMTFNRQLSCFEARDEELGVDIALDYSRDKLLIAGKGNLRKSFASGLKFLEHVYSAEFLESARVFASEAMLRKANHWRDDVAEAESRPTPAPLWTSQDVYDRISPRCVTIPSRGNVSVEFDDGYLFGGHPIEVFATRSGEPKKAEM
ncbi:hypothetical protein CKALI_03940 [Corynebacterium kalinowskii]|uniref:DUF2262 domain-containing protein n=1 Tax=Corynebacterium kalinowskii TaxID=2675216 RepID=A0A6B8VQ21_9CORY|nr:DUF2262 domain-containing protein [Corynebacterium kalinowskii]QGU01667.1 hypothetical protein CKALI_03940 [Corynebacterium kalinowskii]